MDPSSLRADARRNYEHLVRAAEAIFSHKGPFTSLEAIAKRAGVGIGTLYRHFPTRKDLLEAVYAEKIAELAARAQSSLQAKSPDKALADWLQTTVEFAAKNSGFADLVSLSTADKQSPLITAGSSLLMQAQKKGTLRKDVTIFDLLQLIGGIVSHGTTTSEIKRGSTLLSVIMSGMRVNPPTQVHHEKR